MIGAIIGIIVAWQVLGFLTHILISCFGVEYIEYSDGLQYLNPIYIHEQARVNWFGAIMIMLFYIVLCPLAAVCYWFYKLCTVGRR